MCNFQRTVWKSSEAKLHARSTRKSMRWGQIDKTAFISSDWDSIDALCTTLGVQNKYYKNGRPSWNFQRTIRKSSEANERERLKTCDGD